MVMEEPGTLEAPGAGILSLQGKSPPGVEPTGPMQGHGEAQPSVKGQTPPHICAGWVEPGEGRGPRAEGRLGGRSRGGAPS